ncbi:MAG TPA: biosynthetic-type acetolactate synthase large subunit [Bacteroidales bacterium]|nr:biosynthetic-type acetolactate synthase large subunit [Bacteroidales bacterium]HPQ63972.1 biosynthetic-type acetolactate synthase large subunit [Bacteroidales bacterium]
MKVSNNIQEALKDGAEGTEASKAGNAGAQIRESGNGVTASTDTVITGAEALLKALIEEGVDTIFGYPGGAIMPVYDRLLDYTDRLRHILTRHEQGAAHAAQAYAMVTGKPGVCFATSGPGATNLVTGIANAFLDSVPVVFITAQVTSGLIGTDAFQETDILGISMPVTKWNAQVKRAEEIPDTVARAFYIARTGRPGPVLIDIAKDAQFENLTYRYSRCTYIRSYNPVNPLISRDIESAAVMINHAERPMILAGHGVIISGAVAELRALAEKAAIPVAVTLLGLPAFSHDHRLYAGMLGMHGNYAPNVLTNKADLIIAAGMRFDDRVTGNLKKYAPGARVIHIEIDRAEINKNVRADLGINSDAREAITALLPLVRERSREEWIREFRILDRTEHEKVVKPETEPEVGDLTMGEVVKTVSEMAGRDAVVVTDVGQHQMAVARYYHFTDSNRLVTSGGMGTMGFGLPAALGAAVGGEGRQTVVFTGDGGLQMTVQELGTIMQYRIPVKIVLLNNSFLGMVRQWQEMFFNSRYASTELVNPDFVMLASAYGISARKVTSRQELREAVEEMFSANGPFLLQAEVSRKANILPMIEPGASVSEVTLTYNGKS